MDFRFHFYGEWRRPRKKREFLALWNADFPLDGVQTLFSELQNSFPLDNLPKFQILTGKLNKGAFG
ncbi:hypothetical protein LEP1GSC203_0523 [Leptospira terpstrae serovar Hualin str. LT 11-33 = ATCC 700639]|uniref:Uncharacterized protein n=1 Tax=Leptospira terpstrae serovar Hualin str. LT 11-33 = ATCC 700639 TaxID=1257025 RepID=N1VQ52_9LEPT|nr:hypothetical protein LEP1GSC203_0523 [Leptospira terpstrae serovar Hualin str. LT 11-33 = ATCC 700639]